MLDRRRRHPNSVDRRLRVVDRYVEGFEKSLNLKGYSPATIREVTRLLACWFDWVNARKTKFKLENIAATLEASAAVFKEGKSKRAPRGAAALFVRYLCDEGIVAEPATLPTPLERWPLLAAFRRFMRDERGALDSTLDVYQTTLIRFVESFGADPAAYTAKDVRAFTLADAERVSRPSARAHAVAQRAFLRFLAATGRCPTSLPHAIPTFPNWKLGSTPRFLEPADVDRVLAACDGDDFLRDKAIILLLARLGLRASEAADLEFSQIDWMNAQIGISGKSRREERLPLTQEVGDALLTYIKRARPRLTSPRVFLTSVTPIGPVNRGTIKCIVRRALARAGVQSPHRGAHVLRHSAATGMLRRGVSLAGVGAVLRHRSPAMTMHYAKVDFDLLSEVAQPWIGRLPC